MYCNIILLLWQHQCRDEARATAWFCWLGILILPDNESFRLQVLEIQVQKSKLMKGEEAGYDIEGTVGVTDNFKWHLM